MKKLFFSTRYTGFPKNVSPISISILSEEGWFFHAEFTDFNRNDMNFVKNDVLCNLIFNPYTDAGVYISDTIFTDDDILNIRNDEITNNGNNPRSIIICGDTNSIKHGLNRWLTEMAGDDIIIFVGDKCYCDFIILSSLIYKSTYQNESDTIHHVSMNYIDLNQVIADRLYDGDVEASTEYVLLSITKPDIVNDVIDSPNTILRKLIGDKNHHSSLLKVIDIMKVYNHMTNPSNID